MITEKNEHFIEAQGTSEDESDLRLKKGGKFSNIVIGGTDWTTETVLTQLRKGNIELNPKFQRRDAWEIKRKSRFIESLMLGLPVPQIVLAERADVRGKYIVLDGKQRLLCIRQFTADQDDREYEQFRLKELDILGEINGKAYDEIREDIILRDMITAFENQPIRTVIIKNWKEEDLLFHIFIRLNMGSKPLSPQELRQALHPGPFLDFADESSMSSSAIKGILNLDKPYVTVRGPTGGALPDRCDQ